MLSKKSVVMVLAALVALGALGAGIGGYFFYWSHRPHIYISGSTASSDQADRHREWIMVATAEHRGVPTAARVEEELTRLADWNDRIITELYDYTAPYDIRVSGENNGGHIVLRYEGYVTTNSGEKLDYSQEEAFDLYVRDEDFRV